MAFKGSDTWNLEVRNPISYDESDYADDDVPLSERIAQMSNSRKWIRNPDVPVKNRCV